MRHARSLWERLTRSDWIVDAIISFTVQGSIVVIVAVMLYRLARYLLIGS